MHGLLMARPLLIASSMGHAARYNPDREIVSRSVEGPIHRYTYADAYKRMKQLSKALLALGVAPGDRIATLAWNGYRHLELYYGISCIGAVCHTVNPRLFPEQLVYIFNHAEDRVLFTDLTFMPLVEKLAPMLPKLEHVVVMTDRAHMPDSGLPNLLCYEELLDAQDDDLEWPDLDERQASALCYTSGTTGEPKGVLYSHRSTLLHAFACTSGSDVRFADPGDSSLIVVPQFHVCAWGLPYLCPMLGTKIVMPGAGYDGNSLWELIDGEQVTFTAGVPTIWLGLLAYLKETGKRVDSLKRMICGGAAAPESMIRAFEQEYGVSFLHGWGMTETSPVGTLCGMPPEAGDWPYEDRLALKVRQGRAPFGLEMRIVDMDGKELPWDGESAGELIVRGGFVASSYYQNEAANQGRFDPPGWFRTGDVAVISPEGFLQITDRTKDLIKSGGEWISSIDLENAAMGHPDVAEAAAIAVPHPKWLERPLLVIVLKPDAKPDKDGVMKVLSDSMAKWQLPDDVAFIEELPHTATGKISKLRLREQFKDYVLPEAAAA